MISNSKIMVVDDEYSDAKLLESILLLFGYEVVTVSSGEEALEKIKDVNPAVVILDMMMPETDGCEVARRIKGEDETRIIPVVMVTSLDNVEDRIRALEAGADDFLSKPVDRLELQARIKSLVTVKRYNEQMRDYQKNLEHEVAQKTAELNAAFQDLKKAHEKIKAAYADTIYRLSIAGEFKDEETGDHIKRISCYSATIAEEMNLPDKKVEEILYASSMHDVGKIGIPDQILLKPDKLNRKEREIMKQHTVIGQRILEGSEADMLKLAETIALTHHERFDGSGYPLGLKGDKIPIESRITTIADVFDALISRRPYKEAFPVEEAFEIIRKEKERHFDPEVAEAFFAVEERILYIMNKYKDKSESPLLKFHKDLSK